MVRREKKTNRLVSSWRSRRTDDCWTSQTPVVLHWGRSRVCPADVSHLAVGMGLVTGGGVTGGVVGGSGSSGVVVVGDGEG